MGFSPGWQMTLFTALMLPCVIALGLWQLDRGAGKRALEQAYLEQLTRLPVDEDAHQPGVNFQRLRLRGKYDNQRYFLLDNQVLDGQVGYWIIHLFNATSGRTYLVNRGFLAGSAARDVLPRPVTPAGELAVIGVNWPFTGLIPVYDDDAWADGWPKRVQRLDIARMAELSAAVGVQIRLEPGQPGVAHSAPFAAVLSDAKHRGYAATWFGLAAALVVLYLVYGFHRGRRLIGADG